MNTRRNPCELEIDLFCNGLRIDASCRLEEDARRFTRTRAGLGSGLELIIPTASKDLWMNVPVLEPFAQRSPYVLARESDGYVVRDERNRQVYPVRLPPCPAWYDRRTQRGVCMAEIGVLQGTYLGIYVGDVCRFWGDPSHPQQCKFCATGLNVGHSERLEKHVDDVVEVCRVAKEEDGVTFVHFNSGYQDCSGLDVAAPFVRAVRERVGLLIGVQVTPAPKHELWKYDRLVDFGADHFSFCYEFHNPAYFERYLPGKAKTFGQHQFFEALEYTARKLGKGRTSGEIIAGVEPVEDTLRAIDYITGVGAFPTVCIFRPLVGTAMADHPSPRYEDMVVVMRHMYEACMKQGIPIGMTPNIEVSLVCQPTDAVWLVPHTVRYHWYQWKLRVLRALLRPLLARRLRPTNS